MKKIILLICLISLTSAGFAQFGISIGYSSDNFLSFQINSIGSLNSDVVYELGYTGEVVRGVDGEDMSEAVNWDEYPEDFENEGSYYSVINFGIGFQLSKETYLMPKIGYAYQTKYRNMYDSYNILGDNGNYHITKKGESKINLGLEFNYLLKKGWFLGIEANLIGGFGGSIGYSF